MHRKAHSNRGLAEIVVAFLQLGLKGSHSPSGMRRSVGGWDDGLQRDCGSRHAPRLPAEGAGKGGSSAEMPEVGARRPLWQKVLFFVSMVGVLVFAIGASRLSRRGFGPRSLPGNGR